MIYILIILAGAAMGQQTVAITSVEFSTRYACETAKAEFIKQAKNKVNVIYCTPKS